MSIAIEGLGTSGDFGTGLAALTARALADLTGATLPNVPLSPVDTSALNQYVKPRDIRQADHFTRMALLGAYTALEDAGLSPDNLDNTGIVLATGYGPTQRTFDFLDSFLEYGPQLSSPLAFSHSVHNIPAASVALKLGVVGPCCTVCQFESSVTAGLATACGWLAEGRVSRVLFGAVDERTAIMADHTGCFALEPFSRYGLSSPLPPLGEGMVFLCLHKDSVLARHGFLDIAAFEHMEESPLLRHEAWNPEGAPPLVFCSGMPPFFPNRDHPRPMHVWDKVYGTIHIATAFDILLAVSACRGDLAPSIAATEHAYCLNRSNNGLTGLLRIGRA